MAHQSFVEHLSRQRDCAVTVLLLTFYRSIQLSRQRAPYIFRYFETPPFILILGYKPKFPMDKTVAGAVVGAAIVLFLLSQLLLHITQDKREPPALATFIPFLGPIFGMSRKKSRFYIELRYVICHQSSLLNYQLIKRIRDKYRLPICTLRLPGSRLYISHNSYTKAAAGFCFHADGSKSFDQSVAIQ